MWLVDTSTGEMFPLVNGFAIGRTTGDLRLANDGSISSKHCVFYVRGNAVEIEDLGSRNGTFVGEQRIEPRKRLGLMPGVRILVGSHPFEIKPGSELTTEPAPPMELATLASLITPGLRPVKAKCQAQWNMRTEPGGLVILPCSELTPALVLAPSPVARGKGAGIRAARPAPARRATIELRNPAAAYALLAVNLAGYAWAVSQGVDPFDPSVKSLIAIGGNVNGLTTGGQWWRLVTAIFAHAGAVPLAFDSVVLVFLGVPVARLLGTSRFLLVYLVAGLFGGLGSVAFNAPNVVSVGASGAIFGLVGALLAAWLMGKAVPRAVGKFGLAASAIFLVRNIGLAVQGIDGAAHAGALLTGFLLAYLLKSGSGDRDARRPAIGVVASAGLLLVLTMFVPHKPFPREPSPFGARMNEVSTFIGTLEREYREGLAQTKAGKIPPEAFLKFLRTRTIPGVDVAAERVSSVVAESEAEKAAKNAQLVSVTLWKAQLTELAALLETKDESHAKTLGELERKAAAANAELDHATAKLRQPAGSP